MSDLIEVVRYGDYTADSNARTFESKVFRQYGWGDWELVRAYSPSRVVWLFWVFGLLIPIVGWLVLAIMVSSNSRVPFPCRTPESGLQRAINKTRKLHTKMEASLLRIQEKKEYLKTLSAELKQLESEGLTN